MSVHIPVFSEYGKVEMADSARVRQLRNAPNAQFVHRRKDGRLMRVMLFTHGDDFAVRPHRGNPQSDVTTAESDSNPPHVWAFKKHRENP